MLIIKFLILFLYSLLLGIIVCLPQILLTKKRKPAYSEDYYYYTIKKGDTLLGIAQRYHTTVDTLINLNQINNPDMIYAGEKLIISK